MAALLVNISLGSVKIPLSDIGHILLGQDASKKTWEHIIIHYRLPKAITAILVGFGLSISGLLMQTLFRNPLAGPFVLGISSGASLGVALLVMGSSLIGFSFLNATVSLAIAASLGSFLVLVAILIAARNIRDTMAILIIGLMFGSITAAVVNILSFFASMEKLQQYVFWSLGSLGDLSWTQVSLFALIILMGLLMAVFCIKGLNALLLGEQYAKSMGVAIKNIRLLVMLATSLLAGSITAFAGPIAFIGLAVPHITRLIFKSADHRILIPATALVGAIIVLCCDSIAQLPGSELTLPINAITSIVGAPVVIWLLMRKRKIVL
ncbi:iron complex transport system permease protein [Pustulibacterium marinum]|uniref:Iron complex transport system permease protein n=2 Tax=Pustulibacterium marinum TaxID=1224947 RepID=A0A1I7IDY5_9FLAO|nr:iron complex transport system permease protein [Pustulibacterium marinum]